MPRSTGMRRRTPALRGARAACPRTDLDESTTVVFSLARWRRRSDHRAWPGARVRARRSRDQEDRQEGRRNEARPCREFRRLERLCRPGRQGTHLLHAGAAEIARALEPQSRSRLRLHLRPARGRGAQRSVVHHGLRRLRRDGGGSHFRDQVRRQARFQAGGETVKIRSQESGREIESQVDRRPQSLRSTKRPSTSCPRAPISGSRMQRARAS